MPENAESCPRRDVTTVAPQVLWTLNSHVAFDEAQQFAARLVRESGDNPPLWIDKAWRIALARAPSAEEKRSHGHDDPARSHPSHQEGREQPAAPLNSSSWEKPAPRC